MQVLLAKKACQLLDHLSVEATTVHGKGALVGYVGAEGKGRTAWLACQRTAPDRTMTSDLYREMLARCLGSHDQRRPLDGRYHARGNGRTSLNPSLRRSRGGMRTHTRTALLNHFLMKGPVESGVMHEKGTAAAFSQRAEKRRGKRRVGVVTIQGELFLTGPDHAPFALTLDMAITNLCGPGLPDEAAGNRGDGVNVAVGRKRGNYVGTSPTTYKLPPTAISTRG